MDSRTDCLSDEFMVDEDVVEDSEEPDDPDDPDEVVPLPEPDVVLLLPPPPEDALVSSMLTVAEELLSCRVPP